MKTSIYIPVLSVLFAAGFNFCSAQTCMVSISPNATICPGNCTTLNAMFQSSPPCSNVSYSWSSGQTTSSIVVCSTAAGTYSVIGCCLSTGCCDTASVTVGIFNLPNILTSPPIDTICNPCGFGAPILAIGGVSYVWSPGSGLSSTTGNTVFACPSVTTTYTVVGTDANGCTNDATATITVLNPPSVVATPPYSICYQIDSTQLGAAASPPGVTYSWVPSLGLSNPNIQNPWASPPLSTTYTVYVTDIYGCMGTGATAVTVNPVPVIAASGGNVTICVGDSTPLNASANNGVAPYTYYWVPPNDLDSCCIANPIAYPIITTSYVVTVTDVNGCSADTTAVIYVSICGGVLENNIIDEINIFPNPSNQYFMLQIAHAQLLPCEFRIYDLLGREVKKYRIQNTETKITRDKLSVGLYHYRLLQKGVIIGNGKLIIEQ